nr:hypothetical protein [Ramlibacter aurantiacus]
MPEERFDGRLRFQQLVREALAQAAEQGWHELILCDPDFGDWPLNERSVAQSLQCWARRGGRITLLAQSWDRVPREHPRFVSWRRTWADRIEARACRQADGSEFPSAIWSGHWMLERHDRSRGRGVASHGAGPRHLLHERLQEWLRQSTSAFAATTLGL